MIPRAGEDGVGCVNYKALDSEENSVSFGEEGFLFTADGGRKDRQYAGDRLWLYPGAPHRGKVSQVLAHNYSWSYGGRPAFGQQCGPFLCKWHWGLGQNTSKMLTLK